MNTHATPYALSTGTPAALRPARDVEYEAFSRVIAALNAAHESNDSQVLRASVHQNNSLWNTLLADLSSPDNGLPTQLRGDLISLGLFSVRHGQKLMSEGGDPETLININLAIMRGLRGEVSE